MKYINLEIYSKNGTIIKKEVKSIFCFSTVSKLNILPGHANLITPLMISEFSFINKEDKLERYAIGGGVMSIETDKLTILVDSIENALDIDVDRATKSKERAEKRIKEHNGDIKRAELSLKRAMNRINVASNH